MPLPNNSTPDQLREQAQQKIREATDAIKQYKQFGESRDTMTKKGEMNESVARMIKESLAVGGSGEKCPRCGGSGRA